MSAADRAEPCGHPLCAQLGGDCSLATGLSRGCRTGHHPERTIAPAVVAEVADLLALLAVLASSVAADRVAAADRTRAALVRLAAIYRREARDDRHLLLACDDLEPAAAALLTALLRRRR